MGLMPLILLVAMGVMWWFMSRTQKKQQQERQNQLSNMKPGDHVVTIGGLHGILSEADSAKSTVLIDCEGVFLEFDKNAIKTVKPAVDEPVEAAETGEITDVVDAAPEETENKE